MNIQHVQVPQRIDGAGKIGIIAVVTIPTDIIEVDTVGHLLVDDVYCQLQLGCECPMRWG